MSKTIDLAAMKFAGMRKRLRGDGHYTVRTTMDRAKQLYDQAIILEAWENYAEALTCARDALRALQTPGMTAQHEIEAVRLMIAAIEAKVARAS